MSKWIWHGFTATRRKHDGTIDEHKFTSEAQARQFVERNNGGEALAARVLTPTKPGELRKRRNHKPLSKFTPEQSKLREQALKQFVFKPDKN